MDGEYNIALFNTILGLINMDKNTKSQMHSKEIDKKLDAILQGMESMENKLNAMEGRNKG